MKNKKVYLLTAAIALLLFSTNPSQHEFKSRVEAKQNNLTKKQRIVLGMANLVGEYHLCRANYRLFSIYNITYQGVWVETISSGYYIGVLGMFFEMKIDEQTMKKIAFDDCENIKL
jgi:hypothetical protein